MKNFLKIVLVTSLGAAVFKGVQILRKRESCRLAFSSGLRFRRQEQNIEQKESLGVLLFLVIMVALMLVFQNFFHSFSNLLGSSVFELRQVEFVGTEFPIRKVPNWTELSESERKMTYDQLPANKLISIPNYNPTDFRNGMEWRPDNERERNAYITYPVPNLGNYQLDGHENAGSHPGLDVKTPIGTPVHAFASGTVAKVDFQSSGFGRYVLIGHTDFPEPSNPTNKITVYSVYAHLSQQLVTEGQVVERGALIGKTGDTGTATAPHLHFQVETADAPFHPYWPFLWSEIEAAGISSFFEAVNQGLGKENAKKYTLHPIELVRQFENYEPNLVINEEVEEEVLLVVDDTVLEESGLGIEEKRQPEFLSVPELRESSSADPSATKAPAGEAFIEIGTRSFVPGSTSTAEFIVDPNLVASSSVDLSSTLSELVDISPKRLNSSDLTDGHETITVRTEANKSFKIIATGAFGEVSSSRLVPTPFVDVDLSHPDREAIAYLKEKEIVNGYPDGTYRTQANMNRAEAVKILSEANDINSIIKTGLFNDVSSTDWFAGYVGAAVENGIIKGYNDGTFRPSQNMTRAEFLKVAIETANGSLSNLPTPQYTDVSVSDWYYQYVQFAAKHDLISLRSANRIDPNTPINRAEAARVIWKLSTI